MLILLFFWGPTEPWNSIYTLWFKFSFIRNSASLVSDLGIWTLGWNCAISHSNLDWLL